MNITRAIILSLILFSCRNNSSLKNPKPDKNKTATDSLINIGGAYTDPEYAEGARLIVVNDCLTCHQLKEKSVGPSFLDISKKYHVNAGNIDNLASEIIKGSNGFVWGNKQMTPHPNLPYTEAEQMVKYILSLSPDTP